MLLPWIFIFSYTPNTGCQRIWKTWKSWKWPGIFFYSSPIFFSQSSFLYFVFSNFVLYFIRLCILTITHIINFSLFQNIISIGKSNCTFNDDWLIEFEWVEKGSNARTVYFRLCHHTFDISNMGRSVVTVHSKGRSTRIRKILGSHFHYHFLQKRKAMLCLTVPDLGQGQSPHALSSSSHVQHKKHCTWPCFLLNSVFVMAYLSCS